MSEHLHAAASRGPVMWWDGGERAITAREKSLIEEHRPSCFSIPLVPCKDFDHSGAKCPGRRPTATLATVTPPQDLRTRLPKETDGG